jgi:hypothetical protein
MLSFVVLFVTCALSVRERKAVNGLGTAVEDEREQREAYEWIGDWGEWDV